MTSGLATGCRWRAKHPRSRGNAQKSRIKRWFCPARRPWHMCMSLNFTCASKQLLMEMSLSQTAHTGPRRLHFQCTPLKIIPRAQLLTFPQDGFLLCCRTPGFPAGIRSSSLVGTPVLLLHQTISTPPAATAGRKFRVCSWGESSVSKQSSFQNGTKQRQSFPCELELNHFESLNSAQLDKIKTFCPDFNYPLLLNYFIYITVCYAQAF